MASHVFITHWVICVTFLSSYYPGICRAWTARKTCPRLHPSKTFPTNRTIHVALCESFFSNSIHFWSACKLPGGIVLTNLAKTTVTYVRSTVGPDICEHRPRVLRAEYVLSYTLYNSSIQKGQTLKSPAIVFGHCPLLPQPARLGSNHTRRG